MHLSCLESFKEWKKKKGEPNLPWAYPAGKMVNKSKLYGGIKSKKRCTMRTFSGILSK